jgi:hypothetical protein
LPLWSAVSLPSVLWLLLPVLMSVLAGAWGPMLWDSVCSVHSCMAHFLVSLCPLLFAPAVFPMSCGPP